MLWYKLDHPRMTGDYECESDIFVLYIMYYIVLKLLLSKWRMHSLSFICYLLQKWDKVYFYLK